MKSSVHACNRRGCDLLVVCDFKSLCFRRAGNERHGVTPVPVSFQACETRKALDWSAVLQNFARGCFGSGKRLGSRRHELVRTARWLRVVSARLPLRIQQTALVFALFLDTGPPGVRSFAELILQRSLLAHAPPVPGVTKPRKLSGS